MQLLDVLKKWRTPGRQRRVGLVLSGGAVRGAAHLGVLQVFDEHGIRPDLVVGASVGSVVGGLYCAGLSPLELQRIGKEMHWGRLGRLVRPGLGFFDISRMEEVVDELSGGVSIEELEIPFAAVAVDILTRELIVLRQGSLARAIRASASLPGIFTPLEDGGRLLIDGGAMNNLPVHVAQDMGADYLIAVDLVPPPIAPMKRPENIFEMWALAIYTVARARYVDAHLADVYIQPDIGHTSFFDFGQIDLLVEKGREAALGHVGRIKADMGVGGSGT